MPPRPPTFCTGCPERPVFTALKLLMRERGPIHISMDIGCTTFATLPPFNVGSTVLGYGMSLASGGAVGPVPRPAHRRRHGGRRLLAQRTRHGGRQRAMECPRRGPRHRRERLRLGHRPASPAVDRSNAPWCAVQCLDRGRAARHRRLLDRKGRFHRSRRYPGWPAQSPRCSGQGLAGRHFGQ